MLTSLDHIVIAVRDLAAAMDLYGRLLGRRPSWRGEHPGYGTANTLFFGERSRLNLNSSANTAQVVGAWAWCNKFVMEDMTANTSKTMEGDGGPVVNGVGGHDLNQFGSVHNGGQGANFAFADGSIKFLLKSIDASVYQWLSTRSSGEPVDGSKY